MIILFECTAAAAIAASIDVTIVERVAGVYHVRPAVAADNDPIDGQSTGAAANGDTVVIAAGPTFGARLTE